MEKCIFAQPYVSPWLPHNISSWYHDIGTLFHDGVIKWKHFPRYWPFVRGIHRSPVNSPHKGQWRGALMLSLIYAWINDWVNNREAGDLRRQHGHYDVIVMHISGILWGGIQVTGGFPSYRANRAKLRCLICCSPEHQSFALNTQLNYWWFGTPYHSCDVTEMACNVWEVT